MPTLPVDLFIKRSSVFTEKFPVVEKLVEAPSKAISVSAMVRSPLMSIVAPDAISSSVPLLKVRVPDV